MIVVVAYLLFALYCTSANLIDDVRRAQAGKRPYIGVSLFCGLLWPLCPLLFGLAIAWIWFAMKEKGP